jgi:hypothetical protein
LVAFSDYYLSPGFMELRSGYVTYHWATFEENKTQGKKLHMLGSTKKKQVEIDAALRENFKHYFFNNNDFLACLTELIFNFPVGIIPRIIFLVVSKLGCYIKKRHIFPTK